MPSELEDVNDNNDARPGYVVCTRASLDDTWTQSNDWPYLNSDFPVTMYASDEITLDGSGQGWWVNNALDTLYVWDIADDPAAASFTTFSAPGAETWTSQEHDAQGRTWALLSGNDIKVYDGSPPSLVQTLSPGSGTVQQYDVKDGWGIIRRGSPVTEYWYRWNAATEQFDLHSTTTDGEGSVWLGTDGYACEGGNKLWTYSPVTDAWERAHWSIGSFFVDDLGIYWGWANDRHAVYRDGDGVIYIVAY